MREGALFFTRLISLHPAAVIATPAAIGDPRSAYERTMLEEEEEEVGGAGQDSLGDSLDDEEEEDEEEDEEDEEDEDDYESEDDSFQGLRTSETTRRLLRDAETLSRRCQALWGMMGVELRIAPEALEVVADRAAAQVRRAERVGKEEEEQEPNQHRNFDAPHRPNIA